MEKQQTFASVAWSHKGKVTRRERFLAGMDAVVPWADLLWLIAPHYPKAGNGRQPLGLEKMLRIYFVQQWHGARCERAIANGERNPTNPNTPAIRRHAATPPGRRHIAGRRALLMPRVVQIFTFSLTHGTCAEVPLAATKIN